jgi:hypothetical protein
MSAWNQDQDSSADAALDAEHGLGRLPCSFGGCVQPTGLPCVYVDRRGRGCGTAWCPEHRLIAQNQVYCRRHWGTLSGLGEPEEAPLPDVDNRAPSLVNWVGRRLGAGVQAILQDRAGRDDTMRVVSVPVHLVFRGRDRARVWERTWACADHVGHHHAVTLAVAEERPDELMLRVGDTLLARVVPPWITARRAGADVSREADTVQRHDFYESLRHLIAEAVARDEAYA